jgi:hypothetical protein
MSSTFRQLIIGSAACIGLGILPSQGQVVPATPPAPSELIAAPEVAGNPDSDNFTLRLGAFIISSINTRLALSDAAGHGGQEVDLTKDLGIRNSLNVFRADAEWRFTARQKIQLTYFDINRSNSHVLTSSINWGDQTYPVSATVNAHFRTNIYKLNYGYTFFRNETNTQEICGLVGIHVTGVNASLGLAVAGVGAAAEGASITAPLPVFGLEWSARLSAKLTSHVSYEYFGLSLDNKYEGNLSDFQAMLEYGIVRYWNLGVGYNRYTSRATVMSSGKVTGDPLKLSVKHQYNGLMLFIFTSF